MVEQCDTTLHRGRPEFPQAAPRGRLETVDVPIAAAHVDAAFPDRRRVLDGPGRRELPAQLAVSRIDGADHR